MGREQAIGEVDRAKRQGLRGVKLLRRHLYGERLTRGDAIVAKCCECMGCYGEGRFSCQNPVCPLFPYMPYQERKAVNGRERCCEG